MGPEREEERGETERETVGEGEGRTEPMLPAVPQASGPLSQLTHPQIPVCHPAQPRHCLQKVGLFGLWGRTAPRSSRLQWASEGGRDLGEAPEHQS